MKSFIRYFKNPDCLPDDGEETLQESAADLRTGLLLLGVSAVVLLVLWLIEPVLMVLALFLGIHFLVGGAAAICSSISKLFKFYVN